MKRDKATSTIKKLLRVAARAKGPEALRAQERADALMKKYDLRVTLDGDEEKRVVIPGTEDSFWRGQLLTSAAVACECDVLDPVDGGDSVLAGSTVQVASAKVLYTRLLEQILSTNTTKWKTYIRPIETLIRRPAGYGIEASFHTNRILELSRRVWHRAFCIGASTCVAERLMMPKKPQNTKVDDEDLEDAAVPEGKEHLEADKMLDEVEALAALIGHHKADMLRQLADKEGVACGRTVDIKPEEQRRGLHSPRLLTAQSSAFPKKPRGRAVSHRPRI